MSLPSPAPDSIALVTGASSGIGEQYALQLSGRGHRVALVARREARLARMAEELGGQDRATVIAADLAVPEDRDRIAAGTVHAEVEEHGVTVTVVARGPVPSGFQEASDAGYFAERLPKFTFVSADRVAREALARGRPGAHLGDPRRSSGEGRARAEPEVAALARPTGQQADDGTRLSRVHWVDVTPAA